MKNRKMFVLLCSSFMYGALFSCQVPDGTKLHKLEQEALNNVARKQREAYIDFSKEHCLKYQDNDCVEKFKQYQKSVLLNKEKK